MSSWTSDENLSEEILNEHANYSKIRKVSNLHINMEKPLFSSEKNASKNFRKLTFDKLCSFMDFKNNETVKIKKSQNGDDRSDPKVLWPKSLIKYQSVENWRGESHRQTSLREEISELLKISAIIRKQESKLSDPKDENILPSKDCELEWPQTVKNVLGGFSVGTLEANPEFKGSFTFGL